MTPRKGGIGRKPGNKNHVHRKIYQKLHLLLRKNSYKKLIENYRTRFFSRRLRHSQSTSSKTIPQKKHLKILEKTCKELQANNKMAKEIINEKREKIINLQRKVRVSKHRIELYSKKFYSKMSKIESSKKETEKLNNNLRLDLDLKNKNYLKKDKNVKKKVALIHLHYKN